MTIKKKISSAYINAMWSMSAARTLQPDDTQVHPAILLLNGVRESESQLRKSTKKRERENAVKIYDAALQFSNDDDLRREFYARDCWNSFKRKPSIEKNDAIFRHCARQAFGAGRDHDRKVSDLAKVLERAHRKGLTPLQLHWRIKKLDGIRNLYRSSTRAKAATPQIRVSDKARTKILNLPSSEAKFLFLAVLKRTDKGFNVSDLKPCNTDNSK